GYAFANPINYYDLYGLAAIPDDGGGLPPPTPQPVPTSMLSQAPTPTGAQWTEQCTTLPPIVLFMWQEMRTNAQSKTARIILLLNLTRRFSQALQQFPLMPTIALRSAEASGTGGAYALWTWMVRQGGPWDPKPKIAKQFGYYQALGDGYKYYYDVWGNVMYGYLGAATGFSEAELLHGAGAEQIGSSLGYSLEQLLREGHIDSERLPQRRIEVSGLAAFDLPEDRVAIQIGIRLWETYGSELTPEVLLEEITKQGTYLERVPLQP
ncbi:MAG: polymorphic toxin type 44 domain-containing protein, partial [Bacteroidota bacterium]